MATLIPLSNSVLTFVKEVIILPILSSFSLKRASLASATACGKVFAASAILVKAASTSLAAVTRAFLVSSKLVLAFLSESKVVLVKLLIIPSALLK